MKAGAGLCVILATTLLGDAAGQERGLQKVDAEPENGLSLTIRVQTREGTAVRTLADGETLRTGDLVQFMVAVDAEAYVYVVQYFADGSAAVLHPETGDARLPPGYETRIPEPGSVFKLVPPAGEEVVYFIASRRALGEADERVAEAIRMIRAANASPKPRVPSVGAATASAAAGSGASAAALPPPSAFGLGTRGRLVKVPAGGNPPLTIQSGPDGVAIYAFTIRHKAP